MGFYTKIEDRWYAFCDALEARKIPVYKAFVDPLEKRGVPSFPAFIAIVAAVIVALLFALGLFAGAAGEQGAFAYTVSVIDKSTNAPLADASIVISKQGVAKFSSKTTSAGTARAMLLPGSYEVNVSKPGYDTLAWTIQIPTDAGRIEVGLEPQGAGALQKTFCFDPANLGRINARVFGSDGAQEDFFEECGTDSCTLTIEGGKKYEFVARGFSSSRIAFDELVDRADCVQMAPAGDGLNDLGQAVIQVFDKNTKKSLPNIRVRLVNPRSEISDVVPADYTDSVGSASFEGPVGTQFRIKVEAQSNVAAYVSEKTYSFEEETLRANIDLMIVAATVVTVVDENAANLSGVLVSVFRDENSTLAQTETDAAGQASFGLEPRQAAYRAAAKKDGFDYKEFSLAAGRNTTLVLEHDFGIVGRTGNVSVSVEWKEDGSPAEGADLVLKKYNETSKKYELAGYEPQKANWEGKAVFLQVMPGSYCIVASFADGPPTDCEKSKISGLRSRERREINISMNPVLYLLTVNVSKPDGTAAGKATVYVYDAVWGSLVKNGKKDASEKGLVSFDVKRETSFRVIAEYKEPITERQFVGATPRMQMMASKNLSITVLPLAAEVSFKGVYSSYEQAGSERNRLPQGAPLAAGGFYYARFDAVLPDVDVPGAPWDTKWDSFALTAKDGGQNFVEFADSTRLNDENEVTATASGRAIAFSIKDYDQRTKTKILVAKMFVNPGFAENQDYFISYNAQWTKAGANSYVVKSPAEPKYSAGHKINFSLKTGSTHTNTQEGLGVEYWLEKPSGEPFAPEATDSASGGTRQVFMNDTMNVLFKVKNLKQQDYAKRIVVSDVGGGAGNPDLRDIRFEDASAKVISPDGSVAAVYSSYVGLSAGTLEVDLAQSPLANNAVLFINISGSVRHNPAPAAAEISITGGSTQLVRPLRIFITGDNTYFLATAPETAVVYDLTNTLSFWAQDSFGTSLLRGVTAEAEGATGTLEAKKDYSTGAFSIAFSSEKHLVPGAAFELTLKSKEFVTKEISKTLQVKECAPAPRALPAIAVPAQQDCEITLSFSRIDPEEGQLDANDLNCFDDNHAQINAMIVDEPTGQCSGTAVSVQSATFESGCEGDACQKTLTSGTNNARIVFKYKQPTEPRGASLRLKYSATKGNITLSHHLIIPLLISNVPVSGQPAGFEGIQKPDQPLDCEAKWCSLDQAMKQIYDSINTDMATGLTTDKHYSIKLTQFASKTTYDVLQSFVTTNQLSAGTAVTTLQPPGPQDVAQGQARVFFYRKTYGSDTSEQVLPGTNSIRVKTGSVGGGKYAMVWFETNTPIPSTPSFLPAFLSWDASFNPVFDTQNLMVCDTGTAQAACQELQLRLPSGVDAKKTSAFFLDFSSSKVKAVVPNTNAPSGQFSSIISALREYAGAGTGRFVIKGSALVLTSAAEGYVYGYTYTPPTSAAALKTVVDTEAVKDLIFSLKSTRATTETTLDKENSFLVVSDCAKTPDGCGQPLPAAFQQVFSDRFGIPDVPFYWVQQNKFSGQGLDKTNLWGEKHFVVGKDEATAGRLIAVREENLGPFTVSRTHPEYQKITTQTYGTVVTKPTPMSARELYDKIAEKAGSLQVGTTYTTAVFLTVSNIEARNCDVTASLTRVPSSGEPLEGTVERVNNQPVKLQGTYLVSVKKTTATTFKTSILTLAQGTTALAGTCSPVKDVRMADVVDLMYAKFSARIGSFPNGASPNPLNINSYVTKTEASVTYDCFHITDNAFFIGDTSAADQSCSNAAKQKFDQIDGMPQSQTTFGKVGGKDCPIGREDGKCKSHILCSAGSQLVRGGFNTGGLRTALLYNENNPQKPITRGDTVKVFLTTTRGYNAVYGLYYRVEDC